MVITITANGFGLGEGGLMKPYTVYQHQRFLIAQMFLFVQCAHYRKTCVSCRCIL